ncbi:hypothetical protein [Pseudobutyrivibrio sp.]|uniref:hypothetical protein n=1 Tax=Pseudobutyrivibrio sp. TaxID=2014367 RepID=UPI001B4EF09C|nr:hypothetical protein [Pseudobutyrivibrio sp.]MBP5593839.1 hypothetical protein [Pseudobutyrivibrio sp.]MBR5648138.1 hypothetical protein [Pseudobutyrivibrio sp.]
MNQAIVALIIIFAALIAIPVIIRIYQDADYKKQLEGKIPERKFHGKNPPTDVSDAVNSGDGDQQAFKESCDAELRMRGMQNIIGPK